MPGLPKIFIRFDEWIQRNGGNIILGISVLGMWSIFYLHYLHHALRLKHSGHATSVIATMGHEDDMLSPNASIVLRTVKLKGYTTEFPADKVYKNGDSAFLFYSESLHYGVVTATPSPTFSDILQADGNANYAAVSPIGTIGGLILTNLYLLLFAVLEYVYSPYITEELNKRSNRLSKVIFVTKTYLEGFVAGTLAVIPVLITLYAFSVTVRMQTDSQVATYIVYISLLLFLLSHLTVFSARGLLVFFRSNSAQDIKGLIVNALALITIIHVVDKTIKLTFSDHLFDLTSWWEAIKEFGTALIS
jgi:hypothetical protein